MYALTRFLLLNNFPTLLTIHYKLKNTKEYKDIGVLQ